MAEQVHGRTTSRTAARLATRRSTIPSGRAALGALLCTLAALLTVVAYTHARRQPTVRYVVAEHDLEPGAALGVGDLAYAAADLSASLRSRALTDTRELIDATVLGPVAKGELVQIGNVIKKAGGPRSREISFPIDAALAAGGRLRAGDRVSVLATLGSGNDATTSMIAADLPVAHVDRPDATLGSGRSIIITLAIDDDVDASELAQAVAIGRLLLVRTTGARPPRTVARAGSPTTLPESG